MADSLDGCAMQNTIINCKVIDPVHHELKTVCSEMY